jgi:LDH2 family malate/lactate/ureidoglycolate dehydrogenase
MVESKPRQSAPRRCLNIVPADRTAMNVLRFPAASLQRFVEQVFTGLDYPRDRAALAADVLMWASLRGVDTHGVRNLKSYYFDRTLDGQLNPAARIRIDHQTQHSASLDGDSGLGLVSAHDAMQLAIDKARQAGVAMVAVRNTHHLGPAGYFAHLAVPEGMLGACTTGHFFGGGHTIGIAPFGSLLPMFSTNPLSFAAPCDRHPPFVLDMATSVATVNRVEMHAQAGLPIPPGWACDAAGHPTTDPAEARILLPLGGTIETGGYKGAGLAMMVSILSGVLTGAWDQLQTTRAPSAPKPPQPARYQQPTMGHFFAAVRIDAFQPLDRFQAAMDAMIDALHASATDPNRRVHYPGEIEAATALERSRYGVPINDRLLGEFRLLAERLGIELPASMDDVSPPAPRD